MKMEKNSNNKSNEMTETTMRKVVLRKSIRDDYDCDRLNQTEADINPLFYKINKKFLSHNGELMRILLSKFHYLPWCRLVLIVEFEQEEARKCGRGFIKSICLALDDVEHYETCGFSQGWEKTRHDAFDRMTEMNQVLADYFAEIGLPTIHPATVDEMETFISWMEKHVPLMREYFKVDDYKSDDFEAEEKRKRWQGRLMEKAIAELQGFDTTGWIEDWEKKDAEDEARYNNC